MRSSRALLLLLLASTTSLEIARGQAATPRQVAAPASDILGGIVRLPDPASTRTASRAAILPLRFAREGEGWSAEVALPVEGAAEHSILVLSPDAGSWRIGILAGGRRIDTTRSIGPAGPELPGWAVDRHDVRGAPAGEWRVRVEANGSRPPAEGWILASGDPELRVEAHLTTLELVGGEPIGIVARAADDAATSVEAARVVLQAPTGTVELAMADDGLHEDGRAGDGLFGAIVPEGVRGDVRARVELRGRTAEGAAFLRSAVIAFPVLERRLFLDGTARATALDADHVAIAIGALPVGPPARVHLSAEVWGRDAAGAIVPVCWLSRMVDPEARESRWTLPLVIDARWLDVAGVDEIVELREVRVQDPDTEVVIDRDARTALEVAPLPGRVARGRRSVTSDMLTGGTTLELSSHPLLEDAREIPGALMLVHGYCSGGSIWPAADFTQPKTVFLDPNANRSHDQFAQLLAQHAQNAGLVTFGVVAHSQGGCAALHLLTYYASGLDLARGGRRIQSVASPYQGTPLASLGQFACGVNNDMTPAGAATWLAGIPSWARSQVFYWTTSDSGSACNFFTSLILTDPEDGTVEQFRGQLPGANSMGHVLGWCHTTGMSNPANYTDHARNVVMDTAAAR